MTIGITTTAQVINPQVMADMVSAKLPKLIKFTPLAVIDTTLVGRPGDELTVPQWTYSGDATDITEGTAIPIANKVDNDLVDVAKTATQSITDGPTTVANIDKALEIFADEEDARYVALINPKDAIKLRADAGQNWLKGSEIGADIVVSGTFGEVSGVQIVRTKKVDEGKGFLVKVSALQTDTDDDAKYGAFVIALKRDVMIENDRDILKKTTVYSGDEHYGVYLYDDSKVVKFGGA